MAAVLCLIAGVATRIHWIDVRWRVVFHRDIALLVVLRVGLACACAVGLGSDLGDFGVVSWGFDALAKSSLIAGLVAVLLVVLAWGARRFTGSTSLGGGDIALCAACCLFLDAASAFCLIFFSSLGALLAAGGALLRGERTFAFAPIIVWSLVAVLLLSESGLSFCL